MSRRKVVVIAIVFFLVLLTTGAMAFQNEPEGFRGLKWGDPPTEEMEFSFDIGKGILVYKIPDEKMFLGNVPLYRVRYMFYEGRFLTGGMFFRGKKNYDLLETICKQHYGEDSADEVGLYEIHWKSWESVIILGYDYVEGKGTISVSSRQIAIQADIAEKRKQAEKAEGDW